MLTVLIHITDAIRSTLHKVVHSFWVVIESFREAQEFRRKLPRLHVDD